MFDIAAADRARPHLAYVSQHPLRVGIIFLAIAIPACVSIINWLEAIGL